MKLKLKLMGTLCATVFSLGSIAADRSGYQDWWWNPAQSGMGVNIAQQDDHLVASWYHFQQDGQSAYLMLSGTLKNNELTGNLVRTTGPVPGAAYDPSKVTRATVGSGTLRFFSNGQAELTYRFDNQSGTLKLERYIYTPQPDIVGTVTGIAEHIMSQEPTSMLGDRQDALYAFEGTLSRQGGGYQLVITESSAYSLTSSAGRKCTTDLSFDPPGQVQTGKGTVICESYGYPEWNKFTVPVKVDRVTAQSGGGIVIEYTDVSPAREGSSTFKETGKILLMKQTQREATR